jgi:Uma2 family endonuclease
MSTAPKVAPYEDVLNAPPDKVAEVIDGELFVMPRPSNFHARAKMRIGNVLDSRFDEGRGGPGGWIILVEPELHLGSHILVPDVAGWRRKTLPEIPDMAFVETAPDWICEVLSPSTELIDRTSKMRIYSEWGVSHIWLVNPILQLLEVYELRDKKYSRVSEFTKTEKVRAVPFDVIEFELAYLWSR